MLAWGIPSFNPGIHEFRLISIVEEKMAGRDAFSFSQNFATKQPSSEFSPQSASNSRKRPRVSSSILLQAYRSSKMTFAPEIVCTEAVGSSCAETTIVTGQF